MHHQYSSRDSPFQAKTGHALGVVDRAVRPDGHGGGGVVLGGEDVAAAPAHPCTERGQRLDQHGRLDRHVQGAGDAGAGQRLGRAELGPHGHQPGHLVLGQLDLLAAELGQGEVGDLEGAGVKSLHAPLDPSVDTCAGAHTLGGPDGGSATHVLRPLSEAAYPMSQFRRSGEAGRDTPSRRPEAGTTGREPGRVEQDPAQGDPGVAVVGVEALRLPIGRGQQCGGGASGRPPRWPRRRRPPIRAGSPRSFVPHRSGCTRSVHPGWRSAGAAARRRQPPPARFACTRRRTRRGPAGHRGRRRGRQLYWGHRSPVRIRWARGRPSWREACGRSRSARRRAPWNRRPARTTVDRPTPFSSASMASREK